MKKNIEPKIQSYIASLTLLARRYHLTYDQLRYTFKQVRRNLGLSPNGRSKRLPRILTDQELASFFKIIEDSPLSHKIMLKLLFYTGLRVSELVNIKISDIDIKNNKILQTTQNLQGIPMVMSFMRLESPMLCVRNQQL